MSHLSCKELKDLKATWYRKLADSGFHDIETLDGKLKQTASNVYRQAPEIVRQAKEAYYSMLTFCLENYTIDSELDRVVLTAFANGETMKDIIILLHDTLHIQRHRQTIRYIIRKYLKRWSIK